MKRVLGLLRHLWLMIALLLPLVAASHSARADTGIVITVGSYTCNATIDGATASLGELTQNCVEPTNEGSVKLYHDNSHIDTSIFLNTSDGVRFADFPSGEAKLVVTPVKGHAVRAFCSVASDLVSAPTPAPDSALATPVAELAPEPEADSGAEEPAATTPEDPASSTGEEPTTGDDSSAELVVPIETSGLVEYANPPVQLLKTGARWSCTFYQYPSNLAGSNEIRVNVYNCPVGAEKYRSDLPALVTQCNAGGFDGISFSFTNFDGNVVTKTSQNGMVAFTQLAIEKGGAVSEEIPLGYAEAGAFCRVKDANGVESEFKPVRVEAGRIVIGAGQSADLYCEWFNFKAAPGSVEITAFACPAGIEPPADVFDKKEAAPNQCTPQPGVTFALSNTTTGMAAVQQTSGPDGATKWTEVEAGTIQIAETLPNGYANPAVFCIVGRPEEQARKVTAEVQNGGTLPTVDLELLAGESANCAWFNRARPAATPTSGENPNPPPGPGAGVSANPSAPASLTVAIRTCPASYDALARGADPANDCVPAAAGVNLVLRAGDGSERSQQTGADGNARFDGIVAGDYALGQQVPAGTASAFIGSCTSDLRDLSDLPLSPLGNLDSLGRVGVSINGGEALSCAMYNVPEPANAAGVNVTIEVQACPEWQASPEACSPGPAGAQFVLEPLDGAGESVTLLTDESGIASGVVPPGRYRFSQTGDQACFTDSAAFDENGALVIGEADISVIVYNCAG